MQRKQGQPVIQIPKSDWTQFADNPVGFARHALGITFLTENQILILDSLRTNRETNVQAAHGVGKSFISAVALLWWVYAIRGLCVTTAPTERQVKEILWKEVRRLFDRNQSRFDGQHGQLFLRSTEDARAFGFTSRDYSPDSFQGIHGARLLVILDEANGISEPIDDGATSCVTGVSNRLLRIGNPVSTGTPFEKACRHGHMRIPVWEHPNVAWAYTKDDNGMHRLRAEVAATILNDKAEVLPQDAWPRDFPREVIPGAVSIEWIEEKRRKKGEGSSFWISRVEGLFPVDSQFSVIPRSLFIAARARYDEDPESWDKKAEAYLWRHGLDVGDGGDDHALSSWRGPVLYAARSFATQGDYQDVGRAAGIAARTLTENPGTVAVDRAGVGAGALSQLISDGHSATGVHWGESPDDPAQFANLKAEQYWTLREALINWNVAIAPLGDYEEELMDDLASTYYEETPDGRIQIEKKSKTRERLQRSTNLGDSAVIGFSKRQPKMAIPQYPTAERMAQLRREVLQQGRTR